MNCNLYTELLYVHGEDEGRCDAPMLHAWRLVDGADVALPVVLVVQLAVFIPRWAPDECREPAAARASRLCAACWVSGAVHGRVVRSGFCDTDLMCHTNDTSTYRDTCHAVPVVCRQSVQ